MGGQLTLTLPENCFVNLATFDLTAAEVGRFTRVLRAVWDKITDNDRQIIGAYWSTTAGFPRPLIQVQRPWYGDPEALAKCALCGFELSFEGAR